MHTRATSARRATPTWAIAAMLSTLLLLCLAGPARADVFDGTLAPSATPSVSSDKADYSPGETVTLTGAAWAPGEPIHVTVNDDVGQTWTHEADVTAATDGSFSDSFSLPDAFIASYRVTATGPVSGTATTTFTDGNAKFAPAGTYSFQARLTLYTTANSNCPPVGTVKQGFPVTPTITPSGVTQGVGTSEILQVDAAGATTDGTKSFKRWTAPNGDPFTIVSDSFSRSICVPGFQNGTRNYQAIYDAPLTVTAPPDQPAVEGTTFPFNLGSFSDPSTPSTDTWAVDVDWGDGSTHTTFTASATGALAPQTHAYADNGAYTVTVTVRNNRTNESGQKTFKANVQNQPPAVSPAANQSADAATAKTFSLGSFSDPGANDTPWAVDVDWGDGTTHTAFNATSTGALAGQAHTYAAGGTYTVSVKVTDKDGASNTGTFRVTVVNTAPVVTGPADQSATEGTSTAFDLGSFSDTGPDTWSGDVNWGDGSHTLFTKTASGALGTQSHSYADNGTYTASVKVTDGSGLSDSKSFTVAVANADPTATLSNDGPVFEGSTATISFGGQSDPSSADTAAGFHYAFHCDGSAFTTPPTYAGTTGTASTGCSFADDGTYTVRARILDKDDGFSERTTSVTVRNAVPVLTAPSGQSADEGAPTSFDLGSFGDLGANDSPWSVDVDWGDGSAHTTFSTSSRGALGSLVHTYADGPATRTVSVTVTDKDGSAGSSSFPVAVRNVAPTVSAPADHTADEGAAKDFGLGSFTDPGADGPWTVDVDWGDGSAHRTFTTSSAGSLGLAPHAYDDNGTYTVTLGVTDKDGAFDARTYKVTVANVAPAATLGNDGPITEGSSATVSFSGQSDPSHADTTAGLRYAFHCDGGAFSTTPAYADAATSATTSCGFADDGTKTVRALIIDKDGGYGIYTTDVVVHDAPPAVTAPADQSADEGTASSFDLGSFADAGAGDAPWSVDVDWGDGSDHTTFTTSSPGALPTRSHTYADGPVTRTVRVTVTDKDGGSSSKTFPVTVRNVAPVVALAAGNPLTADEGDTDTYRYTISDPGQDSVSAVATSCGANGQKVPGSDTNDDVSGSFRCTFPDGPAGSTVSARATDSDGDQGAADTQDVVVANVAPTVTLIGPASVDEGDQRAYTFTVADPGQDSFTAAAGYPTCDSSGSSGTLVPGSYLTTGSGGTFTCSFPDGPATANVKMKVVDSDGAGGADSESVQVVTVANVPPALTAPADQGSSEGATKSFDLGSFSDPGPDSPWHVDVDWGDTTGHTSFDATSTGTLAKPAHTYADNGTYTVTVAITDKNGGSDSKTFTVTVANVAPTLSKPGDDTADEGAGRDFGLGSFSDPGAFDGPWKVDVDWGDGSDHKTFTTSSQGPLGLAPHAYDDNGTYTVMLSVTDKDGGKDTETYEVTVANVAPAATLGNDGPITEGSSATVSFSGQSDPSHADATAGFRYAFHCDGSPFTTTPAYADANTSASTTCGFADNGTKTVRALILDKDGGSSTYTTDVDVHNAPPALTPPADQSSDEGSAASFDLGSFADPGAGDAPWSVDVDWGDGSDHTTFTTSSPGALPSRSHTYADGPVTRTVRVTVSDKDGGSDSKTFAVDVRNVAPTVDLTGDADVNEGSTHKYTFTVSDPGQDTFTAADGYPTCDSTGTNGTLVPGSYTATAAGGSFQCTFPDGPATANVKMKVADSDGASTTDSEKVQVVAVANVAPTLTAPADQSASEGTSKSFDLGSFADPGPDSPWHVDVDWGDNTLHSTLDATSTGGLGAADHAYADNGTYTVTVAIADKNGGSDSTTFEVTVANVAPALSKPNDDTADEGTGRDFGLGSFSDPGAGDGPWSVDVDWGDATPHSHFTKSSTGPLGLAPHAYDDNGIYTVTLSVADKDGGNDTETYKVTVANVAPTGTLSNNGPITEGSSATISFGDQDDKSAADTTAGFRYAYHCDGTAFATTPAYADADTSASTTCGFADNGTKTVRALILDKDGGSSTYTTDVDVHNAPPALSAPADQSADEGTAKSFDLGSFTDPGANDGPWAVDVDWGDGGVHGTAGATSQGLLSPMPHTFADNGVYTVAVKVTDKDGGSAIKTFEVTVANVAPTVSKPSDDTADEGTSRDFGVGSFTDPGTNDGPWSVDVDWGDGSSHKIFTTTSTGSLGLAPHAYADGPSSYTVTVKVTDKDGGTDTKSYVVTVRNVAPTATLSNSGPVNEGSAATVSFGAQADKSAADAATGFRYAYHCDGSAFGTAPAYAGADSAASTSCSFPQSGTYSVRAAIVDRDGGYSVYSTDVTVANVAPSVTVAADQAANEGTSTSFDLGSFDDPGPDSPWSVDVDWGDGSAHKTFGATSTGSLGTATHTYADGPATKTVSVKVTDADGGATTKTFKVNVANVAPKITSFSGTDYLSGVNVYLGKSTLTTAFADPGADTWSAVFTYPDGSPLTQTVSPFASGQQVTHAFASPGCKSTSVKVTDEDGASDTASTTIKVGTGAFQPPMTNQPVTDKLKNGQVLPVKVHVNDCSGAPVTTLSPAIRLLKGDLTPQSDDSTDLITPASVSAADTSGVMRSQGNGDYIYNLSVNLPSLNTDYTVVVYPYGTGSPIQLGHVVQATK